MPLSRDEIALLTAAQASPGGLRALDLPAAQAGCVRTLIRMGYLIKTANDDGAHGRMVLVTDRGQSWLADNLPS